MILAGLSCDAGILAETQVAATGRLAPNFMAQEGLNQHFRQELVMAFFAHLAAAFGPKRILIGLPALLLDSSMGMAGTFTA